MRRHIRFGVQSVAERRSLLARDLLATLRQAKSPKRSRFFSPRVERLESRQLLTGTVLHQAGVQSPNAGAVAEGQSYTLNLTQNFGPDSQWKVNWGDGSTQIVAGNTTSLTHIFKDGPSAPIVTTELYKPDGTFAGFSPEQVSVGGDGVVFARKVDGRVFRLTGQNWTQLPISFSGFSARNATEIWGFDTIGNVSVWNGSVLSPVPGQQLKQLTVSSDGGVWGINTAGIAVRRIGSSWVSTNVALSDIIATNGGGAHAVKSDGSLVYFTNGGWSNFPGSMSALASGAGNLVYGLDVNRNVFRWHNPNNTWGWYYQNWGGVKSISVNTTTDIWGIDTTGAVVRWNGTALSKVPMTVTPVTVTNVAPTGVIEPTAPVVVNEPYTPNVRFVDSGTDQVQYTAVNWGDGSPIEIIPAGEQPSRRYATAGTYSVTVSAFDEDAPLPPAATNAAGAVVVEASRFSDFTGNGASVWRRLPSTQGALSGVELAAAPASNLGDSTAGSRLDFSVNFASAGLKYAWVRVRSPQAALGSIHLGLNGIPFSYGGQGISTSSTQWEWVRTVVGGPPGNRLNVQSPAGAASLNLWSRSGRLQVDQILLTTDANFSPVGRLQETRSLTSSYTSASTSVVVTSGFQPTIPIPVGSLLPVAAVDLATILSGQSVLVPITRNDFDPDGQAVSLASVTMDKWESDLANVSSFNNPPTVSIESGNLRISTVQGTTGSGEFSYVIQDATNNQATGRLLLRVNSASPATPQASPFNAGTQAVSPAAKYVTREETDVLLPSAGIPVELKRAYSSDRTEDQGFGPGWAFNYGSFVNVAADGASFVWTKPDGTTENYAAGATTGGNTSFSNLLGNGTTALRTVAGATTTIAITTKYGERYQFNVTGQRGRLVEIRDRNANIQSVSYLANGMISQVSESFTGSTPRVRLTFVSNANRITAVNDDKGRSWSYEYAQSVNASSYLSRALLPVTVAGGAARPFTSYQYSPLTGSTGLMTNVTERTGEVTQFTYHLNGRLDSVTTAGTVTARYRYDDATNRRETIDGTGGTSIERYNGNKAVLERSENGVLKILNEYDANGRLTKVTRPGQEPVLFTHDAKGNILTKRAANGVFSKFEYDPNFSQVTRVISDVSLSIATDDIVLSTRTLDARGNLTEEVDALLNKTIRTYDSRGQVTSITDPRGASTTSIVGDFTTEFVYNSDGQLTQRRLPTMGAPTSARPVETLTYDGFYNLLSQTDPTGVTTTFQYDRIGQLLSKSLPAPYPTISTAPITTRIEYDNFGRVAAQIDGRGNRTQFQWNASGRLAREVRPNGSDTRTTYDAAGRPLTVRNENGLVTQYEYDLDGNLKTTIFPDGRKRTYEGTSIVREADGGFVSIAQNAMCQTTQSRDAIGGITTWTYNTRGQVASTTDPRGQVTSFTYDLLGRVIETRVANLRVDRVTFDAVGNTTAITSYDISGLPANTPLSSIDASRIRVTSTTFDASNQPLTTTSPDPDDAGPLLPSTQTTVYDAAGRQLSVTDARGNVTSFQYDNAGRLHKTILPATAAGTAVLTSILDANGNESQSIDALGRTTIKFIDSLNRVTATRNAFGHLSNQIAYDPAGNPIVSIDFLERATHRTYDSRGNVVKLTLPDPDLTDAVPAPTWLYQYDALGRLTQTTDPIGRVSANIYDTGGRVTKSLSPLYDAPSDSGFAQLRQTKAFTYNAAGDVLTEVTGIENAAGASVVTTPVASRTTTRTYDAQGRLLRVTNPDPDGAGALISAHTQFTYNGFGDAVTTVDHLARTTSFAYDKLGRKIQTTLPDPDGAGPLLAPVTRTAYDQTGNVIQTRDANNNLWQYSYDAIGRQTAVTAPDSSVTRTVFDLVGNPVQTIDAKSLVTDRVFDALNRTTSVSSPPTVTGGVRAIVQTAYDGVGNVTSIIQSTEAGEPLATINQYDRLDRLISTTLPDPDGPGPLTAPVTRTGYDSANRKVSMTDPLLRVTQYAYDSLDRPTVVTLPDLDGNQQTASHTTQTLYYDVSQSQVTVDARGQRTTTLFDALGRLIQETKPAATTGVAATAPITRFTYDNAGNIVGVTDPLQRVTTFTFDTLDRKRTQSDPNAGAGVPTTTWSYDANGNVTSITDPLGRTTTQTYDSRNRKTSITHPRTVAADPASAAVETFAYDVLGNVTSRTDALGRVTTFAYDNLSRLTVQTLPDPNLTDAAPAPTLRFQYDVRGNQIEATDQLGRITRTVYDRLSRPIQTVLPIADGSVATGGPTESTVYDAASNIVRQTDRAGRVTLMEYDAWNRQTKLTLPDPDGTGPLPAPFTLTTWDAAGNVHATTDQIGRREEFRYDNLNRQIGTTLRDPDGTGPTVAPTTSQGYDLVGNLVWSTDTLGRTTSYVYDAANRLTQRNLPSDLGGLIASSYFTSNYTYDLVGNLLTEVDELGRVTTYVYDARDRQVRKTLPDPDGVGVLAAPWTESTYDLAGNLLSSLDHLGRQTAYQYDRLDRQTRVTSPDPDGAGPLLAPVTQFVYDDAGNTVATIDPRGNRTAWTYDNWNRKKTQRLPSPSVTVNSPATGPLTSWIYDVNDNVLSETDPLGRVTTSTYDSLDRLLTTTLPDPDGAGPLIAPQTINTYNAQGMLATTAERLTATSFLTTTYAYDQWDRKIQSTDPRGAITRWTYDTQSNLTSVIDPGNNATTYAYDRRDRRISETNSLGLVESYATDKVGNLVQVTDRNGMVINYQYDNLDRVILEQWFNPTAPIIALRNVRIITTSYTNAGMPFAVTDPDSTTIYSYDSLDRKTGVSRTGTSITASAFAYSYDVAGNLTTTTQTVGSDVITTNHVYDGINRPTEVSQTGTAVRSLKVNYPYNLSGDVTSVQRYQSSAVNSPATILVATTDFALDALDRPTAITHRFGTTTLAGYGLTYDAASRITQINSTLDGITNYTLDAAGQLTAANRTVGASESFAYDAAGNRTGGGNTVGANNQLLRDGTYAYTYDGNGNRITRTVLVGGNPTGAQTRYTYDFRNRLTAVRDFTPAGVMTATTTYTYDGDNNRLTRSVDVDGNGSVDQNQRYIIDNDHVTAVTNAAGAIQNRYLHGPVVDEVLADIGATGNVNWALADHQNTVRDIASFNGSVTAIANHRTFSSYGQMLAQTNAATDLLFGFTGRELDPQTGLNYYRDRWYDPLTGEFTSEDPIGFAGGDTNLSRYVGNSPVDYADPTGNSWLSSLFRKAKREVSRVVGQVREVVSDAFRDVRDFAQEYPVLTGLAALATGTWFVAASGGIAGAFANVGTLVNKAIGSIMVNPFTPASSGIGGTYSVSVGSFAKLSVGAGVSGTSAFAGANVSVLGLPVWGVGPTVGIFGNVADPIASTLAGNFTDSVSRTVLSGSGSIDVGSFVRSVAVGTAKDFAYSQLNQTGLPLVLGVASQTAAFTSDVYGAFRDVLTPPLPVYVQPPVTAQQVASADPETGQDRGPSEIQLTGHVQKNPYAYPRLLPPVGARPVHLPPVNDSRYKLNQDWMNGDGDYELPPLRSQFGQFDSYFAEASSDGSFLGSDRRGGSSLRQNQGEQFSFFIDPFTVWLNEETPVNSRGRSASGLAFSTEVGSPFWAGAKAFIGEATRQVGNFALDEAPFIGTIKGLGEAYFGVDALGNELSTFDRFTTGVGAIPGVGVIKKAVAGFGALGTVLRKNGDQVDNLASPVNEADEVLSRLGTSRESASRLGRKAEEAEKVIGIHGVSVSGATPTSPASQAARKKIEEQFRVHDTPTRNDRLHKTVELPKPVTQAVADVFNSIFGR
jgi:RHS repeat-associated protein